MYFLYYVYCGYIKIVIFVFRVFYLIPVQNTGNCGGNFVIYLGFHGIGQEGVGVFEVGIAAFPVNKKMIGLYPQHPRYFFNHLRGGEFPPGLDFAYITGGCIAEFRQFHLREPLFFAEFLQIPDKNMFQVHLIS